MMSNPSEMHSMYWNGMGGWMFLWWILLILAIAGIGSFFFRQQDNKNRDKSATDILKERYARGEISKQEFEEMKRDIL